MHTFFKWMSIDPSTISVAQKVLLKKKKIFFIKHRDTQDQPQQSLLYEYFKLFANFTHNFLRYFFAVFPPSDLRLLLLLVFERTYPTSRDI